MVKGYKFFIGFLSMYREAQICIHFRKKINCVHEELTEESCVSLCCLYGDLFLQFLCLRCFAFTILLFQRTSAVGIYPTKVSCTFLTLVSVLVNNECMKQWILDSYHFCWKKKNNFDSICPWGSVTSNVRRNFFLWICNFVLHKRTYLWTSYACVYPTASVTF